MPKKNLSKGKSTSVKLAKRGKQFHGKKTRRPKRLRANSKLTRVAVKIGAAIGKADRTAHEIARAGVKEIEAISGKLGL
jgi:hypothetical protein